MLGPGLLLVLAALVQEPHTPASLPEGNAYVRSLVGRQRAREDALNRYTYDVLEADEQLDGNGRVKKRATRRYEVFHVKGLPVRRWVEENGKPLDPDEQKKEDRRVREKSESFSKGLVAREQPDFRLSQILERYDFKAVSREPLASGEAILLEFQPLPGKRSLDSDNVLRAIAGRIWVDEVDQAVAKAEIRNTSGIKFGWGLGASVKSLDVDLEFLRMTDGVWLPLRISATASGRMLVFKGFRTRRSTTYSNWKRFEVDTDEEARPVP